MNNGALVFSENIYADFQEYCKQSGFSRIVFLCDENTSEYCLRFFDPLYTIVIPPGEVSKSLHTYQYVVEQLKANGAGRASLLVNLGGGVVTDIGGFAASTYMRGIPFVNIPTTLVGMADAAIGGKNGIDFLNFKNYLGTFALPEKIFIAPVFLKTLPENEWVNGYSEIIKTAVIAGKALFEKIRTGANIELLINETAQIKQSIVANDLYDKSNRQLLNFGHTMGHAYESSKLAAGQPVMHGIAVAKGMLAETKVAHYLGLIDVITFKLITELVTDKTGQTDFSIIEFAELSQYLGADKKNESGHILMALPTGIGSGKIKVPVTIQDIQHSLFNVAHP